MLSSYSHAKAPAQMSSRKPSLLPCGTLPGPPSDFSSVCVWLWLCLPQTALATGWALPGSHFPEGCAGQMIPSSCARVLVGSSLTLRDGDAGSALPSLCRDSVSLVPMQSSCWPLEFSVVTVAEVCVASSLRSLVTAQQVMQRGLMDWAGGFGSS